MYSIIICLVDLLERSNTIWFWFELTHTCFALFPISNNVNNSIQNIFDQSFYGMLFFSWRLLTVRHHFLLEFEYIWEFKNFKTRQFLPSWSVHLHWFVIFLDIQKINIHLCFDKCKQTSNRNWLVQSTKPGMPTLFFLCSNTFIPCYVWWLCAIPALSHVFAICSWHFVFCFSHFPSKKKL